MLIHEDKMKKKKKKNNNNNNNNNDNKPKLYRVDIDSIPHVVQECSFCSGVTDFRCDECDTQLFSDDFIMMLGDTGDCSIWIEPIVRKHIKENHSDLLIISDDGSESHISFAFEEPEMQFLLDTTTVINKIKSKFELCRVNQRSCRIEEVVLVEEHYRRVKKINK
jgi:hypothetical protein